MFYITVTCHKLPIVLSVELKTRGGTVLECTMARCVWVLVDHDLLEHMIATPEPDARSWLFSMMDVLSHDEFTRMTVTLWEIWYARRKLIHEGINQSPYEFHMLVSNFSSELYQISVIPEPTTRGGPTCNNGQIRWFLPDEGLVKINVDAVVLVQHNAGTAAAICRDRDGSYLGSSMLVIQGIIGSN